MKTILIPIATNVAYRNLFFYENSFFDQLKKYAASHPDFFFVVLLTPKDYNKRDKFLGEGYGKYFEVEQIPAERSSGPIQKLFYFFYSYLLYTRTTAILATMGTRPGEPPAGGRRLLAPLKWLISRTFGKSDRIRLRAVPWLFLRLFRDRPLKELFDRYNPSLVFATHIYGWPDAILLAEARCRGIRTVGMPSGWDHLDKYYLPFHTERLLVPSEEVLQSAVSYQSYKPEELTIVGYPYFDFLASASWRMPRETLLKELGFPPDARLIVYVSGSSYCPDEHDVIQKMADWADNGELPKNIYFAIRPYIGGGRRDKQFDERKFSLLANNPRIRLCEQNVLTDFKESCFLLNIYLHADVIVQVYTTVALEVAIFDRPIISPLFDGNRTRPFHESIRRFEQFEHFQDVIKTGALPQAHDFNELKKLLNSFLKNPDYLMMERKKLKDELCGPLDGKNSERIVNELLTML